MTDRLIVRRGYEIASMKDYHHVLMIRIRQRHVLYKPKQVSHEDFLV